MKKIEIKIKVKKLLADIHTPVSIYLRMRDVFPNSVLLESSDYHTVENSYSFICMKPVATFKAENDTIIETFPSNEIKHTKIVNRSTVIESLGNFLKSFSITNLDTIDESSHAKSANGLFGYFAYDAVQYFEDIKFIGTNEDASQQKRKEYDIPAIRFSLYKYIIAINHFKNELEIIENSINDETGTIDFIKDLLQNKSFANYPFKPAFDEVSNITDNEYMLMVTKGKESCRRGNVFQIVLSRQFSQTFTGDEFNVYRALRSINPSPYLFYFDYGNYKIFGSSPESQIVTNNGKVTLTPIAGSIKRTGQDHEDKLLAEKLANDAKENSEHIMLVDLARNDLSRDASEVKVEVLREVQYYSHILHLVSKVTGKLKVNTNVIKVMADTFPAGTLSGAPKYKAMELIDKYENQNRGYYGGCIGFIGFNGDINQAIMIRSFLSKNNTLFYQAGAGIIVDSKEENELNEVNNKLMALKKAIELAQG